MKKLLPTLLFLCAAAFSGNATVHTILATSGFVGNTFSPNTLTFPLGDTVLFQWANGNHNTTSQTIPAGAAAWAAPLTSTATTYQYVPAVVGVYNYNCTIHPGMAGTFTVQGPAPTVPGVLPAGPITACVNAVPMLTASSVGAASYQWKLNGVDIPGATGATHMPTASGSYTVVASNVVGTSGPSAPVVVTLNPAPTVTATPTTMDICLGGSLCDTLQLNSNMAGTAFTILVPNMPPVSTTGSSAIFCLDAAVTAGPMNVIVEGTAGGCTSPFPVSVNVVVPPNAPAFTFVKAGLTYTFSAPATPGAAYTWIFGDNSANGSGTAVSHTYAAAGNYVVKLVATNAASCTDTTTQSLSANAIRSIAGMEGFSFGPNPAANSLNVQSGGLHAELNLMDGTGRLVRKLTGETTGGAETFDLSGIAPGMYMLQVKTKEGVALEKLLVR